MNDFMQAKNSIAKINSVQELNDISKIIKERIKTLKGNKNNYSKTGENLTISNIKVSNP